ncbi:hypothetical protein AX774_g3277 [Zancudomyces culisetae]|uniref:WAC domain-containing protein n=1 Tax=Zancudomyces culisetae TaxID=1213189 RepID=A0A1R1PQH5_ZANCU|nr:hypothetical protein AX774_g3277 [Zancudomyces culisetae]|eukprot:OMH83220.1 hypothetical protein AX774_g3277 [Zancudomyces culisetae]
MQQYLKPVWECEVTGKDGLTYEEALTNEIMARREQKAKIRAQDKEDKDKAKGVSGQVAGVDEKLTASTGTAKVEPVGEMSMGFLRGVVEYAHNFKKTRQTESSKDNGGTKRSMRLDFFSRRSAAGGAGGSEEKRVMEEEELKNQKYIVRIIDSKTGKLGNERIVLASQISRSNDVYSVKAIRTLVKLVSYKDGHVYHSHLARERLRKMFGLKLEEELSTEEPVQDEASEAELERILNKIKKDEERIANDEQLIEVTAKSRKPEEKRIDKRQEKSGEKKHKEKVMEKIVVPLGKKQMEKFGLIKDEKMAKSKEKTGLLALVTKQPEATGTSKVGKQSNGTKPIAMSKEQQLRRELMGIKKFPIGDIRALEYKHIIEEKGILNKIEKLWNKKHQPTQVDKKGTVSNKRKLVITESGRLEMVRDTSEEEKTRSDVAETEVEKIVQWPQPQVKWRIKLEFVDQMMQTYVFYAWMAKPLKLGSFSLDSYETMLGHGLCVPLGREDCISMLPNCNLFNMCIISLLNCISTKLEEEAEGYEKTITEEDLAKLLGIDGDEQRAEDNTEVQTNGGGNNISDETEYNELMDDSSLSDVSSMFGDDESDTEHQTESDDNTRPAKAYPKRTTRNSTRTNIAPTTKPNYDNIWYTTDSEFTLQSCVAGEKGKTKVTIDLLHLHTNSDKLNLAATLAQKWAHCVATVESVSWIYMFVGYLLENAEHINAIDFLRTLVLSDWKPLTLRNLIYTRFGLKERLATIAEMQNVAVTCDLIREYIDACNAEAAILNAEVTEFRRELKSATELLAELEAPDSSSETKTVSSGGTDSSVKATTTATTTATTNVNATSKKYVDTHYEKRKLMSSIHKLTKAISYNLKQLAKLQVNRLAELGVDRFGTKYYYIDQVGSAQCAGRLFVRPTAFITSTDSTLPSFVYRYYYTELGPKWSSSCATPTSFGTQSTSHQDDYSWPHYSTVEELDHLIAWLDNRGTSEAELLENLNNLYKNITMSMRRSKSYSAEHYQKTISYLSSLDEEQDFDSFFSPPSRSAAASKNKPSDPSMPHKINYFNPITKSSWSALSIYAPHLLFPIFIDSKLTDSPLSESRSAFGYYTETTCNAFYKPSPPLSNLQTCAGANGFNSGTDTSSGSSSSSVDVFIFNEPIQTSYGKLLPTSLLYETPSTASDEHGSSANVHGVADNGGDNKHLSENGSRPSTPSRGMVNGANTRHAANKKLRSSLCVESYLKY